MSKGFLHGSGGVAVKRASGTVTPLSGCGSANLGFKPDLVVFPNDTFLANNKSWNGTLTFPFSEDDRTPLVVAAIDPEKTYFIECSRNDSGFSFTVYYFDDTGAPQVAVTCPSLRYIAVKYT